MKQSIFIICLFTSSILIAQNYQVGDHELLLMPTAYTMPVNNSYFTDYEVVLLNYSYAVSPTTHLGIFSLFPFRDDFHETISLGVKQKVLQEGIFNSAFYASYTFSSQFLTLGNVISIGNPSHSFHASLGYTNAFSTDATSWLFLLGYRIDPSENTSIILEYSNGKPTNKDFDADGLLSVGLRVRSDNIAFEVGGMKNLDSDDDWFIYPVLKATYCFD